MRWRRIRREAYSLPVRLELDWGEANQTPMAAGSVERLLSEA